MRIVQQKQSFSRRLGRICVLVLLIFTLILAVGMVFPTWTPRIVGENSISELKQVKINGTGHEVMIRGEDRRNPVIIFVHGGPGCSEIPYIREYQDLLESNFTIVHYDQRGSGKSYHFFEDYSSLTADLLVDDLLALTDYVVKELGSGKVVLAGHSYGTYIGMKAAAKAPEKFAAYIGIGQVSDHVQSELDALNYSIEQANLAGNKQDAEQLERLRFSVQQGAAYAPRDMVRKYGGAARLLDDNKMVYKGLLLNPEYNLLDAIRYIRGISISQEKLLKEEAEHNITELVDRLDIPCYFVMGQYDYMTSAKAAKAYFDQLAAPKKEFVLFKQSAHYPQLEEKELFAEWLVSMWNSQR